MKQLRIKVLVILVVASVGLMLLDYRGWLSPEKSAVDVVIAPVKYSVYSTQLGLGDFFSFLTFWKSGEARIKNLEQRNLELVAFEAKASDLERENATLRGQLGVKTSPSKKLLPATVLGSGQYLEIGVGKNDGVVSGESVAYLDNLVGKIGQLNDRTSFVQLPTDSQAVIPVKIGKVSGLVSGQFNSSIVLDRVAANEQINIDDNVLTSGEGQSYVPGLIVGKIQKIVSAPTDLFQKAQVTPQIDYGKLTTVFVMMAQ